MKRTSKLIATSLCLAALAVAQEKNPDFATVPEEPSAEAIAATEAGFEFASTQVLRTSHQIAASKGYRQRDSRWLATLPADGFSIIPLQLYAGNDYFICLGTDGKIEDIGAAAFDPDQMLVKSSPDRGEGTLNLHITPTKSGPHYLRLHLKNPSPKPVHCALTYIYK